MKTDKKKEKKKGRKESKEGRKKEKKERKDRKKEGKKEKKGRKKKNLVRLSDIYLEIQKVLHGSVLMTVVGSRHHGLRLDNRPTRPNKVDGLSFTPKDPKKNKFSAK